MRNKKDPIEIKWNLIGILGKLFIDLLFFTTRIESVGLENLLPIIQSKKFIFAFWHSRILLVSYIYKNYNGATLVSQSKDGEIIAQILQRQGHQTIRGSTSKGGLRALACLIKEIKGKQKPGAVIPDGPRGPRFKAQPGVITLAKKTGYPILPVSYSAKKIKIFQSWDRFILPYPFTTCRFVYGHPLYVPQAADKDTEKQYLIRLENELCRITCAGDRYFGHNIT
ncbi:MAG: lysophospholipid acyltransferase family protein [Desulfobacterales bacterium]|nr:lysophospholipid acyltransferase family protein [Desulfobacterales bacterium]